MYGKYLVWSVFLKIVTGSYQHRHQFVVCCVTDLPQGEPNLPVIYKRRLLVVFYPFEVHCTTAKQNSVYVTRSNQFVHLGGHLVVSFPLMTNNIVQFFES